MNTAALTAVAVSECPTMARYTQHSRDDLIIEAQRNLETLACILNSEDLYSCNGYALSNFVCLTMYLINLADSRD